jgi:hypothetical protein
MSDKSDFDRYLPEITKITVVEAAQAYRRGDEILSVNGKQTATIVPAFILLLATDAGTHGPFLLNATCARALYALLQAEGFGPRAT